MTIPSILCQMRLPKTLRTYLNEARSAFAYAPIEVVLGVLLAVTFSIAVRQRGGDEWWAYVGVGVVLALPLVFGLSVLRARRAVAANLSWVASAIVLASVAAYAAWIFDPDLEAEMWRAASLTAAAVLTISLVPVVGRGEREGVRRRVWAFAIELLLRVAGVLIYAGLLFAALAGAVAAVSTLFELKTPDHLYADLAGLVFFALVPWVVAGGVPALAAAGEAEPDGTDAAAGRTAMRAASLLGRFLYVPVLGVYLLILYAYTIKVLATGELPKNLLSPIILFAGLAGFLGGVLLEPLRRDAERRGVARLVRAFPLLLLPLLPLAVWAVGVRLAQYGWTEFRYLRFAVLLALVLLAVAGTVRLLRRRAPLLVAVPAVLAAVLLLSAVGPWSAPAVSRRDQQARLRSGLAEAGLLGADGRLDALPDSTAPARVVPKALYDRISGSATYLYRAHGPGALAPIVPEVKRFDNGWALVRGLRLEAGCEPEQVQYATAALPDTAGIPDLPVGTLYRLNAFGRDERRAAPLAPEQARGGAVRMQVRGAALVVS
ncbi:MAG TPA: DUF4153 domain-containing protein, partial [Longimicrobiaceae bacterium]|nr:DUF4153 domain-containing protein [Longimicrobiaceae bacterium]